jgi:hypothetical protein
VHNPSNEPFSTRAAALARIALDPNHIPVFSLGTIGAQPRVCKVAAPGTFSQAEPTTKEGE